MGYVQITEPPIVHPLSSDVWIIGCVGNPLPSEVARGEEHGVRGGGGDSVILEGGTQSPVDA